MRAIVTGHSRGLGAAVTEDLLSRDVAVSGVSRRTKAALHKRFPALRQSQLDLSDSNAVLTWIRSAEFQEFLSGPDAAFLVNNAGLLQPVGRLEQQDAVEVM